VFYHGNILHLDRDEGGFKFFSRSLIFSLNSESNFKWR